MDTSKRLTAKPKMQQDKVGTAGQPAKGTRTNHGLKRLGAILLILVVVGAAGWVTYKAVSRNAWQNEYAALASGVAAAQTAEEVAGYHSDLDALYASAPGLVAEDIYSYVKLCTYYGTARESESLYTETLAALEILAAREEEGLGNGIEQVSREVAASYESFSQELRDNPGAGLGFNPLTFHPSLEIEGEAVVEMINGEWGFSFNALNASDKEIIYFEFWIYCFDQAGAPVLDEYGEAWDWDYAILNLEPGASHTPEEHGHWPLYFEGDEVDMLYPYISYVEYADGTTEGVSLYDAMDSEGLEDAYYACIDAVGEQAAAWAGK